MIGELNSYS